MPMPMRQVHLDFHTSRDFGAVAARFDAEDFASVMAAADVAGVNIFAKCHHGYSYFPTGVGTRHPGLGFDLLGQQISALHARGIRAPIYLSVLWDDLAGEMHPEWVVTDRTGRSLIRRPLSADTPLHNQVGWSTMDIDSGYGEYVIAHVAELCARYPVDGFWFDIVWPEPNYSPSGQQRLRDAGVDLEDADAVHDYARRRVVMFCRRLRDLITATHPHASVFFNGTVDAGVEDVLDLLTHIEIESLPTSGDIWGYTHYPLVARFARTLGKPMLGMTGRFHAAWADFGGLKTANQLEYEVGTIMGAGGAVCIGDQLHPDGRLDPAVYRTVGRSFSHIRELEPFWVGGRRCTEVAVLGDVLVEHSGGHLVRAHTPAVAAAVQLLTELGLQVDVVDPAGHGALTGYRLIVVPDGMHVEEQTLDRLESFRSAGGTIALSGDACLDGEGSSRLSDVPYRYEGPAPTGPAYVRPTEASEMFPELATDYDYVLYDGAHLVAAEAGSTVSGSLRRAAFDRRWDHFTSHAHAPVGEDLAAPLVVVGKGILYFAAPLLSSYGNHEYWVYRALVASALEKVLPDPVLVRHGPAWIEASVHVQGAKDIPDAYVVSLTSYQSRRTGSTVPRVDEGGLTAGTSISLLPAAGFRPGEVTLEPGSTPLSTSMDGDRLVVSLPPLGTHRVVVVRADPSKGGLP